MRKLLVSIALLALAETALGDDPSLVAHYLFNGNARDTSGYGNHGTPLNGAALSIDRFGQPNNSYHFDGVDDYIAVPDAPSLDISGSVTLCAWIKSDTCPQTSDGDQIVGKGTHLNENYEIGFFGEPSVNLLFLCWIDGSPHVPAVNNWLTPQKVGVWKYLSSVYNNTNGTVRFYEDGDLILECTGLPNHLTPNDDEFQIGANYDYSGTYYDYFKGSIDDIRVYNRALDSSEIRAIYHQERPFTLQFPQLISPPNNANLDTNVVQFFWNASDSADHYRLQSSLDSLFGALAINQDLPGTNYQSSPLSDGRYFWRVKAYKGAVDSSAWSAVWAFIVDTQAPLPPVLKSPPDNAWVNQGPNLEWSPSAGADVYGVQVSNDSTFSLVLNDTITADTFRWVPPLANNKYFWRVAAGDSNGNWSGFGEVRRFRLDTSRVRINWTWPLAGQGNVRLADTVKIRFSEPVVISSFDFTCDPNPGGWSVSHSAGRDTFRLAHAPFDTSTGYTFTVTNAMDSAGNWLVPGPVNNPWTFTTTADGAGPVLRHTPVAASDSGVAIPLTAYATDPGSGVQQVILYFRQGGREEFTEVAMSHPSDSTYQAQIPAPEVSVSGLSYYLRAVDNLGAQTFSPNGAPAFRHQPRVSLDNVVYGSTLSGGSYRMFAFPFETAGPPWRPSQLADDLGTYDATVWRLFRWQSGAYAEYEAVQDIIPGRAYWIINRNGGTFDLADGRTVADSASHIPLASGWNMVGAPFNYPVNLSDVRVYAGPQGFDFLDTANTLTERRLVDYDGSGYANKTRMDQWHGYWVRALTGGVTMMVPAASATDKSAPISDPEGWTLSLEASCGGYHDRDNRVGITPRGARDNASEPPAVGAGVSLVLENNGKKLAEDYRSEIGQGQCWRFTVECGQEGPVDLVWHEEGERGWQYAVYDVGAGRAIEGGNYRYQAGRGSRQFAVLAGSPEYIASEAGRAGLVPSVTLLEKVRPNPFVQLTIIRYQIARPGLARITVYNVLGQKVRTLVDEAKAPGRYEIAWDGRDGSGRRAGAGVYFCRMEADGVCATVRMALLR